MPIPKPRQDETREEFISRCMGANAMQEYDQEQRLGICYSQWRNRDKSQEGNMERKSFTGMQLKADKPGHFIARIATLNVIDADGDVTLPGAFPEGKSILISAYQHGSWSGGLPVGKATIHEEGDDVTIEGEFNLKTDTGKEHYETVKFAPELQEWSYGFIANDYDMGKYQGQNVRFLKVLDVFEASPVLRGAGVDTAVLAIKDDKGLTFADQVESVLAAVSDLVTRAKSLADLRHKEGRDLSSANRERILQVKVEIDSLLEQIRPGTDPELEKGRQALLELLKFQNTLLGVK